MFGRTISADTVTYKGLLWDSDEKTLKTQVLYLEVMTEEKHTCYKDLKVNRTGRSRDDPRIKSRRLAGRARWLRSG